MHRPSKDREGRWLGVIAEETGTQAQSVDSAKIGLMLIAAETVLTAQIRDLLADLHEVHMGDKCLWAMCV